MLLHQSAAVTFAVAVNTRTPSSTTACETPAETYLVFIQHVPLLFNVFRIS